VNSANEGYRQAVSPRLEQKVLYWLAVLSLMVDKYDVDVIDLKHDLNIQPKEWVSPIPDEERQ
jgi:adenylate cyclase